MRPPSDTLSADVEWELAHPVRMALRRLRCLFGHAWHPCRFGVIEVTYGRRCHRCGKPDLSLDELRRWLP